MSNDAFAPLSSSASSRLGKAIYCLEQAESLSSRGMAGPATDNLGWAQGELDTLYSTFADVSPEHPE
ncbi:MAG: hypothetical protein KC561_06230, partial [Myxococcales bacterium]|nr:hypothetical protein [Myxococcales bacterium]